MIKRNNSLVSIIIPTFNRAHLIGETLDSLLAQTYTNWECIVVDDGSTDNTSKLLESYCQKDARFQYHHRPNNRRKGANACRNYGFEKSIGEYINWFDSDDLMKFNKLEIDLKNLLSNNFDFTISQSDFFNKENSVINKFWNNNLYSEDPINDFIQLKIGWGINSPLWRKSSLINQNLNFDENLVTATDFFYHIRAIENKLKPIIIDRVLVSQRIHNQRLENLKIKSPYKVRVNSYLLKNKKKLGLNEITIGYLKVLSVANISNLYKNKIWIEALKYSFLLFCYTKDFKLLIKFIYLFIVGSIFCFFGFGYRFFKLV